MMLPRVTYPKFVVELPSNKKKVSMRPFLVHEEKILLMAKTGKDIGQIMTSVKQVVQSCVLDKGFNVEEIPIFDLEYLYIKLVAVSISNIKKLAFRDNEDGQIYNFDVDLNDVKIVFPDEPGVAKIEINETVGIVMRMPRSAIFSDREFLNSGDKAMMELALRCIDIVYEGDKIYKADTVPKAELEAFIDQFDMKTYERIKDYLFKVPKLYHLITYTNKAGNERRIELTTLDDFFTFR